MANREREDSVEPEPAGTDEEPRDVDLVRRAAAVLDANWLGAATSPSVRLYPHQWSWDSACIAMGYAPLDQSRAETELRSLFAGQWRNGLLPHIVFTDGKRYFPGPEVWGTNRSPDAPDRPRTSGIVQPPIHATAAWQIYRRAADRDRAVAFLEELFPKLVAWHGYLYRERARNGDGLVEIWHPWESGMDNSPLWDAALDRIDPAQLAYERVDVQVSDPAERPSDAEYDRYVHLVDLFRGLEYRADAIREATPFALQPVLFNSLLVQANRDLAEIARHLGAHHDQLEWWAAQTAAALEERLWVEEHGVYVDFDLTAGEHVGVQTATGLSPLYAGVPDPERAAQMIDRLRRWRVEVGQDGAWAVASFGPDEPGFQPTRYWRGPIWPIVNWVVARGLERYGYTEQAAAIRAAIVDLSRRNGFWEHYSPVTGRGHGAGEFAWTAGLVLDLLHENGR
jgi:mannosylglycerate hydrolase